EYAFQGYPTNLEPPARNFSYHEEFTKSGGAVRINPVTGVGPVEGRPPSDIFAHQRWEEFAPKVGYVMSLGQVKPGVRFHPEYAEQKANAVWTFGPRAPGTVGDINGIRTGTGALSLVRMRYNEPMIMRIHNDLPDYDPITGAKYDNGGFGRNEPTIHFHNAHNGAESDGACNAYHFPGTFYDYHWATVLARRDRPDIRDFDAPNWRQRASTPTDDGGYKEVEGDFREIQGTKWFHDHRFFFTAENVYKGYLGLVQMYSGPDRGNEVFKDPGVNINLNLPSGSSRAWGNVEYDVYLAIRDVAFDADDQLTFDIFDTDGFLGDVMTVNEAAYPYLDVLPRRYRFRLLNAGMARYIKLAVVVEKLGQFADSTLTAGQKLPFWVIANDGNLLPKPFYVTDLEPQGPAERFDIIVDFARVGVGAKIKLVNVMKHKEGRRPDAPVSIARAMRGDPEDPAVGPILEFRVLGGINSVDEPGKEIVWTAQSRDPSVDFSADIQGNTTRSLALTTQIPVDLNPVRTRVFEFKRSGLVNGQIGDSRDPLTGLCTPDCGEIEAFPWSVRVNGESTHSLNANRISALIPDPGSVENWVFQNGGGGWDHPIHLHFEEAITLDRAGDPISPLERLARKDVWRLGVNGKRTVRIQVRFGEFGGSYVAHCHNTLHEDFAMLIRWQLWRPNSPQAGNTKTPIIARSGVTFEVPEVLPEGDPTAKKKSST
ncbi:MAG: multicopper oxidase domain-containing protein, partial [Hyphomicrobiaceae bacterium]|nr:multicopper oxidase domain-containing protein [Hyphomicrobiaceae bacterium]